MADFIGQRTGVIMDLIYPQNGLAANLSPVNHPIRCIKMDVWTDPHEKL